ncbi:MAG: ATP-binding cassette domain-containing protein [Chloroflexota bacterium]|nr:ATP-binding cassette domain-containing protein [Chloroflexota bacterium]
MTEPVVQTRNLYYRYRGGPPEWVLEDLNLEIEAGEYLLICGPSGSGKSTLCQALNGLIPQFYGGHLEGEVRVDGLDTVEHPVSELFAHVGIVFQNAEAQLFNSTVEGELAFGLESLGWPQGEINERVTEIADAVQITHLLRRNPHQLSGGEQKLVLIAAALAPRPPVLVLDEPYASLDPANVDRVRRALNEIHNRGTTVVVVEHRLENAVIDAERMVVLHQGRIVLEGLPEDVLARDITRFGLRPPAAVRVGKALNLGNTILSVESLIAATGSQSLPPDLFPAQQAKNQPKGKPLLEIRDVAFSFQEKPILRGVNFALHEGECLALVGANGSGKTTLIKHFNGLYKPDHGHVLVLGQDTRRAGTSALAHHVGLVFQNANDQFFKSTVKEEIEVGARTLGCYDEDWLRHLIALFHLQPLLDRSPHLLSGGEKKRVSFAAALAARPKILVFDEPTVGQDWPFRQALGDLLGQLQDQGRAVVLVTHDLDFAEQCADRWVLLAGGKIRADGSPDDVMNDTKAMRQANLKPTQSFRIRQALGKGAEIHVAP